MKTEKYLIYLILASITGIVLLPFIKTGLATGDDAEFMLSGLIGNFTSDAVVYAKGAGRFYFLITKPLYNLPYLIHNLTIIKTINIILLTINLILLSAIVKRVFNQKWTSYLFYLLLLTFITIKGQNNPIVSFEWYFTGSFIFILSSIFYSLKYSQSNKVKHRFLSIALFIVGLLFYEVYMLYIPIIILTSLPYNDKIRSLSLKNKIFNILKISKPFIIIGLIYILTYFIFRIFYPPTYSGTSIADNFRIKDGIDTILNLSRGAYPCYFFFFGKSVFWHTSPLLTNHIQDLGYVLKSATYLWYIKALVTGSLSFLFLNTLTIKNTKRFMIILAIAIIYIYIPQIPLALTEKYTYKYPGADYYITTLFGYFSAILTVTLLFSSVTLIPNIIIKRISILLVTITIGIGSILTDYINFHAVKDLQQPLNTLNCMDKFIETTVFDSIPDNAFVFSPNLYTNSEISYMYNQGYKWDHYVNVKTKKNIMFVKSKHDLINAFNSNRENIYYLKYDYNKKDLDQFIAFGAISQNSIIDSINTRIFSDSVTCFYYSTHKEFTVSFSYNSTYNDKQPYFINNKMFISDNNYAQNRYKYWDFTNFFSPIKIKASNIEMNTLNTSHLSGDKKANVIIY